MNLLRSTPALLHSLSRPMLGHGKRWYASSTGGYSKGLSAALVSAVYHRTLSDGSMLVSRVGDIPSTATSEHLPPPLKAPKEKKYHLSETDQAEMWRLREEDPDHWTQKRLAEKFGCSRMFVAIVAPCPKPQREVLAKNLEQVREQHGYKRRLITYNRQRRRALW